MGLLRGLLIVALTVFSWAALAQDVQGVAVAAHPEEGFQACHGSSADGTLNCARTKCQSEHGQGCLRVRWCYPAGYSGTMSYLANREVTQLSFLCGAPSEAGLLRMLAGECAAIEEATECRLMVMWAPDGSESERQDLLGKNTSP
ncbi:MAG: hypothetical protein AAGB11_05355 [Pseudomonadota bacterium]